MLRVTASRWVLWDTVAKIRLNKPKGQQKCAAISGLTLGYVPLFKGHAEKREPVELDIGKLIAPPLPPLALAQGQTHHDESPRYECATSIHHPRCSK